MSRLPLPSTGAGFRDDIPAPIATPNVSFLTAPRVHAEPYAVSCDVCRGTGKTYRDDRDLGPTFGLAVPCFACDGHGEIPAFRWPPGVCTSCAAESAPGKATDWTWAATGADGLCDGCRVSAAEPLSPGAP